MELAGWWLLSFVVWLVAVTALSPVEVTVAALLAVPSAWVARRARRQVADGWTFRSRWFAPARRLPAAVVVETAQVWRAAVREVRGDRRARGWTRAADPGEPAAYRAVAQALLSASPGCVVVDAGDTGRVHSFREHPDALEKAVTS